MEIIANGVTIPFTLSREENLTELIKSLLILSNEADKLVTECKVNGEIISLMERNKYQNVPISDVKTVELTACGKSQRISELLEVLEDVFSSFISSFTKVADLLVAGQKHSALKKFSETLSNWREVVNFLRIVEATGGVCFNLYKIGEKTINQANEELFSLLTDIKKAIEVEDTVTISDLIEYELKDKITEQQAICKLLKEKILLDGAELKARIL